MIRKKHQTFVRRFTEAFAQHCAASKIQQNPRNDRPLHGYERASNICLTTSNYANSAL